MWVSVWRLCPLLPEAFDFDVAEVRGPLFAADGVLAAMTLDVAKPGYNVGNELDLVESG